MQRKIIIVDDDPNLLAALRRRLGRKYHVTTVLSAEDGLSAVEDEGPYAVVVSNQRMGGLYGVGFLRRLRDTVPDTIRILLTGNVDPATEERALDEAVVFRSLNKPCAFTDIVTIIDLALDRAPGAPLAGSLQA